jgi:prepilin-type N-terminal cleavage/methylation domain-containing protein
MPRLIAGPRGRRGVTIPELLVAMILLAIIGGSMTRVMVKQQQYYRDASASAAARRELRLGATLLPAEIRSISTAGGDILSMTESEITMRAAIGSGTICARGPNVFYMPPTNLAHHTLTSFASAPVVGDTVFLYDENLLKGSEDDVWRKFAIGVATTNTAVCVGAPYTDPVLDLPATKPRLAYEVVGGPIQDSVKVGAVARFTRPVRYKIYQETSGSWYLGVQEYKTGAWQGIDPLAGPYRPFASGDANPSGLQFRYYDTLGVRITNYANVTAVGRIDVFLRTNAGTASVTERNGAALRDSIVMRVAIRNSK